MMDKVGITIGDVQGIGPEVSAKALLSLIPEERERVIVIGYLPALWRFVRKEELKGVEFIDTGEGEDSFSGLKAIELAVELAKNGRIKGLCTGPVSKARISKMLRFVGHTEFLQERFGVKRVEMIFVSKCFNLILATRHIPLRYVADRITPSRIREVIETAWEFRERMGIDLPIGVCGLNPHAGEEGKIGKEEVEIIKPAIAEAGRRGIEVLGPFPADTIFRKGEEFSVIVSMYHDQGLPVLKRIDPSCVNLTWGLPIVRTSPPHGTAYDIAGRGVADFTPMREAIRTLFRLLPRPEDLRQH